MHFLSSYSSYRLALEPEHFDVCPVLLAQSDQDKWTPLHLSELMLSRVKKVPVKTVILENAGHYPLEDRGLHQMADAVIKLLIILRPDIFVYYQTSFHYFYFTGWPLNLIGDSQSLASFLFYIPMLVKGHLSFSSALCRDTKRNKQKNSTALRSWGEGLIKFIAAGTPFEPMCQSKRPWISQM